MPRFADTDWSHINALRERITAPASGGVAAAAKSFVAIFAEAFSSVVLARLFLVVPFSALPPEEQLVAAGAADGDPRLRPATRVLSLLGTAGREPAWCDRTLSAGHRAIPLLDRAHVESIPMIACLLAELRVDMVGLDDGRSLATKPMLGGLNAKFVIGDAQTAKDAKGRFVVPSRDFVSRYGVRTVFGMGGAYVDGTLAVAVFFTNETVDSLIVDRFPSLISNFKMASAPLLASGRIYG